MKNLLIISSLILSTVMFSSPSYAKWEKVTKDVRGTFYVDFEGIKKVKESVYFWELGNYLKPTKYGILSAQVYNEGDCKLFRFKNLIYSFHKKSMGAGTGDIEEPVKKGWKYPSLTSSTGKLLKFVCNK